MEFMNMDSDITLSSMICESVSDDALRSYFIESKVAEVATVVVEKAKAAIKKIIDAVQEFITKTKTKMELRKIVHEFKKIDKETAKYLRGEIHDKKIIEYYKAVSNLTKKTIDEYFKVYKQVVDGKIDEMAASTKIDRINDTNNELFERIDAKYSVYFQCKAMVGGSDGMDYMQLCSALDCINAGGVNFVSDLNTIMSKYLGDIKDGVDDIETDDEKGDKISQNTKSSLCVKIANKIQSIGTRNISMALGAVSAGAIGTMLLAKAVKGSKKNGVKTESVDDDLFDESVDMFADIETGFESEEFTEGANLDIRSKFKKIHAEYKSMLKDAKKNIKNKEYDKAKANLEKAKKVVNDGIVEIKAIDSSVLSTVIGFTTSWTVAFWRDLGLNLIPVFGTAAATILNLVEKYSHPISVISSGKEITIDDLNAYKNKTVSVLKELIRSIDNLEKKIPDIKTESVDDDLFDESVDMFRAELSEIFG